MMIKYVDVVPGTMWRRVINTGRARLWSSPRLASDDRRDQDVGIEDVMMVISSLHRSHDHVAFVLSSKGAVGWTMLISGFWEKL